MKNQHDPYPHSDDSDSSSTNERATRKRKAVYTIIDREGSTRSYWMRLGTAFVNRDDSLTVYLNALPVNGRLHIRELPESHNN